MPGPTKLPTGLPTAQIITLIEDNSLSESDVQTLIDDSTYPLTAPTIGVLSVQEIGTGCSTSFSDRGMRLLAIPSTTNEDDIAARFETVVSGSSWERWIHAVPTSPFKSHGAWGPTVRANSGAMERLAVFQRDDGVAWAFASDTFDAPTNRTGRVINEYTNEFPTWWRVVSVAGTISIYAGLEPYAASMAKLITNFTITVTGVGFAQDRDVLYTPLPPGFEVLVDNWSTTAPAWAI